MSEYSNFSSPDLIVPGRSGVALTASANTIPVTRAIHCNTAGTITVQFVDDDATVDLVVVAGGSYAYQIQKLTVGTGVRGIY